MHKLNLTFLWDILRIMLSRHADMELKSRAEIQKVTWDSLGNAEYLEKCAGKK